MGRKTSVQWDSRGLTQQAGPQGQEGLRTGLERSSQPQPDGEPRTPPYRETQPLPTHLGQVLGRAPHPTPVLGALLLLAHRVSSFSICCRGKAGSPYVCWGISGSHLATPSGLLTCSPWDPETPPQANIPEKHPSTCSRRPNAGHAPGIRRKLPRVLPRRSGNKS